MEKAKSDFIFIFDLKKFQLGKGPVTNLKDGAVLNNSARRLAAPRGALEAPRGNLVIFTESRVGDTRQSAKSGRKLSAHARKFGDFCGIPCVGTHDNLQNPPPLRWRAPGLCERSGRSARSFPKVPRRRWRAPGFAMGRADLPGLSQGSHDDRRRRVQAASSRAFEKSSRDLGSLSQARSKPPPPRSSSERQVGSGFPRFPRS